MAGELKTKRVLFQGDSITDCGRDREDTWNLGQGYPKFFAHLWEEERKHAASEQPTLLYLNRGISGDRTKNLLERFDTDVADLEPDVLVLMIGINNAWRAVDANDPTAPETFEAELETFLQQTKALASQPAIIILEPFLLETADNYVAFREDLNPKIEVTRRLAKAYADLYVPLDGLLNARALNGPGAFALAEDGVHPTEEGHETIADYLHQYLTTEAADDLLS